MRDVITTGSKHQPFFFQPINEPGFVAIRWKGKDYLLSTIKATELKIELEEAIKLAERKP